MNKYHLNKEKNMKVIKLLVILIVLLTIGCTSSNSYKEISFEGIIELCADNSEGDSYIFSQCLDNQEKAAGKLSEYLGRTHQLKKFQNCLEKNTDDQNKTDLVKVSICLGLGSPGGAAI
jgi:hypothetical protein